MECMSAFSETEEAEFSTEQEYVQEYDNIRCAIFVSGKYSSKRKMFDKEVQNTLKKELMGDLRVQVLNFFQGLHDSRNKSQFVFVNKIPRCYSVMRVKMELDADRDVHYSLGVPKSDTTLFRNQLVQMGLEPNQFRYQYEGQTCLFRFAKGVPLLKEKVTQVVEKSSFDGEEKNIDFQKDFRMQLFGKNMETVGEETAGEIRALMETSGGLHFLAEPPSEEEVKKSQEIAEQKLTKTQKVFFDTLQDVFQEEGGKLLLDEDEKVEGSFAEKVSEWMFSPGWKEESEKMKSVSKLSFPVPRGVVVDAMEMPDPEASEQLSIDLHQDFVSTFQFGSLGKVSVNVNSRRSAAQVQISDPTAEDVTRIELFAKMNPFVSHDIIEDVKKCQIPLFKLTPNDFDPFWDKHYFREDYTLKTLGGIEVVQMKCDWVRIALNIHGRYPEGDGWIAKWAKAYHGSQAENNASIARERDIRTDGYRQLHREATDVNPRSDRKGQSCNTGAYFARDPRIAEQYAGYVSGRKCIFEARIAPSKTRIPDTQQEYRIVNKKEFTRITGICVKVGRNGAQEFGFGAKDDLKRTATKSTVDSWVPVRYLLPLQIHEENPSEKRRYGEIVSPLKPVQNANRDKVILVVGLAKSGKTTFINGLVNHLLEVGFNEYYRYEIQAENGGQKSMYPGARFPAKLLPTEYISSYSFQGPGDRYTIIDTPGYGDKANVQRDSNLDTRMSQFLSNKDHPMPFLDALCFVIHSNSRDFPQQARYLFDRILSLFGKDISSRLILVSTFDSERKPTRDYSSQVAFAKCVRFENSCLFADNKNGDKSVKRNWVNGCSAYQEILDFVSISDGAVDLSQTKIVAKNRVELEKLVLALQEKVQKHLHESANLAAERNKLKELRSEVNKGAVHTVNLDVHERQRVDKVAGQHVTVCLTCEVTCHEVCSIAQDQDKYNCWAMDLEQPSIADRHCRICEKKCHWKLHSNTPFIYKTVTQTVAISIGKRLKAYKIKEYEADKCEQLVAALEQSVKQLLLDINRLIEQRKKCLDDVSALALKPVSYASTVEYIDHLIRKESFEQQPGFQDRIQQLQAARKGPEFLQNL